MSTRQPKLGMIVRSKSCPWLRGMVRTLTRHGAYLVTPYGRHYVRRDDLTTCARQGWLAMLEAPPLPSSNSPLVGKDFRHAPTR
jgi:hypothetical protein